MPESRIPAGDRLWEADHLKLLAWPSRETGSSHLDVMEQVRAKAFEAIARLERAISEESVKKASLTLTEHAIFIGASRR